MAKFGEAPGCDDLNESVGGKEANEIDYNKRYAEEKAVALQREGRASKEAAENNEFLGMPTEEILEKIEENLNKADKFSREVYGFIAGGLADYCELREDVFSRKEEISLKPGGLEFLSEMKNIFKEIEKKLEDAEKLSPGGSSASHAVQASAWVKNGNLRKKLFFKKSGLPE